MIGLGVLLWFVGIFVPTLADNTGSVDFGWTAYSPLGRGPAQPFNTTTTFVFWLFLIVVWTVASLLILRTPRPKDHPPPE